MWTAVSLFLKFFSQLMNYMNLKTRQRSIDVEIKTRKKAAAYERLSRAIAARRAARDRFLRDGVQNDGYGRD